MRPSRGIRHSGHVGRIPSRAWNAVAGSGLMGFLGCSVGPTATAGLAEPIVVHGTQTQSTSGVPAVQFFTGDLPGYPPLGLDAGSAVESPAVKSFNAANNSTVLPGEAGKSFTGAATDDGSSVGIRFADMGTGYWVVPLGIPSGQVLGALTFGFSADFAPTIAPGRHPLRAVAIDNNGNAGTAVDISLCVDSRIPDNGHTCNPAIAAPAAVMTLAWDTNFDVDLHVILPDGLDVNPKDPLTVDPTVVDAGLNPSRIDRDSLGGCVPDGLRQEDLVFQTPPPAGLYDIYANPFASCGQADAHFTFTLYLLGDDGDLHVSGTPIAGELLGMQANGGTSDGLFVVEQQF